MWLQLLFVFSLILSTQKPSLGWFQLIFWNLFSEFPKHHPIWLAHRSYFCSQGMAQNPRRIEFSHPKKPTRDANIPRENTTEPTNYPPGNSHIPSQGTFELIIFQLLVWWHMQFFRKESNEFSRWRFQFHVRSIPLAMGSLPSTIHSYEGPTLLNPFEVVGNAIAWRVMRARRIFCVMIVL